MRRRTPAKVNLFLEVGGLRSDGYHDIVSLIDPVGLFDLIDFSPARNWKVTFLPQTGIDSRDNTVTRVLSLLQQHLAGFPPMKITVKKGIPLGAGLGGGSSDAACVLRVLNKLLGINFSRTRLLRLAERVGADVPAFIGGERCLVWGKGEKIKAIPARCKLWYVILLPARPVSTASVYAWYDRLKHQGDLTEARRKIRILIKKLDEGDVAGARRCLFNRLQEASEKEYPEIRKMRGYLEEKFGQKFLVSGSGGAIFSIFPDETAAQECAASFVRPGWQVKVVPGLNNFVDRRGYGDYRDKSVAG